MHLAGLITDKKLYALSFAQKWLASRGVTIDLTALDAAIEAAVWAEFNKDKAANTLPNVASVG